MDAIVMAGGAGSRLRPALAAPIPKHLVTIGSRPMISHVLNTLARGGVNRIFVSLNGPHSELTIETIASLNIGIPVAFTYSGLKTGGGPGRDLAYFGNFVTPGESFIVTLADALFSTELDLTSVAAPHLWSMELDGMDDPAKYGQLACSGNKVTHVWEKPAQQMSTIIQTGIWKLPFSAFERTRELAKATIGELHIGDITMTYVEDGAMTHTRLPPRSYLDCGTPAALKRAQKIK